MTAIDSQRLRLGVLALALGLLGAQAQAQAEAQVQVLPSIPDLETGLGTQPRATVYIAKRIVAMDPRRTVGEAVAVLGDRVLAVGSLEDLKHAAGDRPFVLDESLKDKVLVPGFIDRGLHPLLAALTLTAEIVSFDDWVLPDGVRAAARDRQAFLARLAEAESKLADPKSLLLVWGWHPAFHGELARADLDGIVRNRPVAVWHRSGLSLVLNGAALERYAVTPDFLIRQDVATKAGSDLAHGRFAGQGAAALLALMGPAIATPERLRRGQALVEDYLHASGLTAVSVPVGGLFDGGPGESPLGEPTRLFRTWLVPDAKSLVERWRGDGERLLAQTERLAAQGGGKTRFLPRQVKLPLDGDPPGWSGRGSQDPGDAAEGRWTMDPGLFARAFEAYWDAGYQIQADVRSEESLGFFIDNLERQMSRRPRFDHRTTAVGLERAAEGQVRRLARLGALLAANPYNLGALGERVQDPGRERGESRVLLGSAKRAGLPIALQSDLPLAPASPLLLIQAAVGRGAQGGAGGGSDQRLAVEDALAAVTINAAYSLRLENEIGSIEPGKLANFTVLEADPLTVPSEQIDTIGVWGTVLEGRVQPVERPSLPARTASRMPLRDRGDDPAPAMAAAR